MQKLLQFLENLEQFFENRFVKRLYDALLLSAMIKGVIAMTIMDIFPDAHTESSQSLAIGYCALFVAFYTILSPLYRRGSSQETSVTQQGKDAV